MSDQLQSVGRWERFELVLDGPCASNPFVDVGFGAEFCYQHRVIKVNGFYDGDGRYAVRFMPDVEGEWRYRTCSNAEALDGVTGSFICTAPGEGNHGPVSVRDSFHFAYADGSPFYPVGTTCYVWNHQGDELEAQTLRTLAQAPFNKMRMCIFPKSYRFNENDPDFYPFASKGDSWDWARFDPAYYRHLESLIEQLGVLGIEADLILFHPYDRWGFADMPAEVDDRYLRYTVARLASFRNVWWSMANEFDLMRAKTEADWDRYFRIVQENDPYQHLRSVHNCRGFYDHNKPWVTHQSIQHRLPERTSEWRQLYGKPVVIDETQYEGNIPLTWGNIPPQEMVRKFWEGTVRGGYVGHGETYVHPEDVLWWSKGGLLYGESPARIAFLRRILEEGPDRGLDPVSGVVGYGYPCAAKGNDYFLAYCGITQPSVTEVHLPDSTRYEIDVIDTWAMTIDTLPGVYGGDALIDLPGKPYIALRMRRLD